MDEMCENPGSAPNLSRIANPNSSNARSKRTSHHLLLALRAYTYLTLISAGRADSIRRIRISEVNKDFFIREISKMRTDWRRSAPACPTGCSRGSSPTWNTAGRTTLTQYSCSARTRTREAGGRSTRRPSRR